MARAGQWRIMGDVMAGEVAPRFVWTPRRLLLNAAVWTAIAALLTIHLFLTNRSGLPHRILAMRAAFNYWTCAVLAPFVISWAFAVSGTRLRVRIPLHIAGYLVFHVAYTRIRTGLAHYDDPSDIRYGRGWLMVLATYEFQNLWLYIAQVVAAQAL